MFPSRSLQIRLSGDGSTVLRVQGAAQRRLLGSHAADSRRLQANSPLFTITAGSPPVTLSALRIEAPLAITGGRVELSGCTFSGITDARALTISGGDVVLRQVAFRNNSKGGIVLQGGTLAISDSELSANRALRGAAMRVSGGAASVARTRFEGNVATLVGGALDVTGGRVALSDQTQMIGNTASHGSGLSLIDPGAITYELPTPSGHWVEIEDGGTLSTLKRGVKDDYPTPCGPGYYGDGVLGAKSSTCSGLCELSRESNPGIIVRRTHFP